jgi:hypothetical protein
VDCGATCFLSALTGVNRQGTHKETVFVGRRYPPAKEERIMRTLGRTAVALGFIGAMAIGTAVPVMAQGIYFNAPGVHVGIGRPYYYYHPYYHRHYYDYYGGWRRHRWDYEYGYR